MRFLSIFNIPGYYRSARNGFFIQGTHYLWMVLLLTLIARSPGALSLDRFITRRLSV
jgi:uncharacterized membrane protein YphA (DoxX/SURF4 family)